MENDFSVSNCKDQQIITLIKINIRIMLMVKLRYFRACFAMYMPSSLQYYWIDVFSMWWHVTIDLLSFTAKPFVLINGQDSLTFTIYVGTTVNLQLSHSCTHDTNHKAEQLQQYWYHRNKITLSSWMDGNQISQLAPCISQHKNYRQGAVTSLNSLSMVTKSMLLSCRESYVWHV